MVYVFSLLLLHLCKQSELLKILNFKTLNPRYVDNDMNIIKQK